MEKRAKDLEGRVGELERECEALRRENGWLKGLVVGVTGGSVPVGPGAGPGGVSGNGNGNGNVDASAYFAQAATGSKRDRDESA